MAEYLVLIVTKLLALTLPWPTLYWLAIRLAGLNYRFSRSNKMGIRSNLRVILGERATEEEVDKVARETFNNFGKYMLEFFGYSRVGSRFIEERVRMVGIENLDEARGHGKGVVVLSAHLSNWELGAIKLADVGYPVAALALDHETKIVNRLFVKQRARKGVRVVASRGGARKCLEALRRNELVCLMGDRDIAGNGIELEYFGKRAKFPVGPARFSLAAGAPIVPAFMIRGSDNAFDLVFEDPIYPPQGADKKELVRELTGAYLRVCERYVGAHPRQFANFFPMWKE